MDPDDFHDDDGPLVDDWTDDGLVDDSVDLDDEPEEVPPAPPPAAVPSPAAPRPVPPTPPAGPRRFVPLVDQLVHGEIYRGKVEVFRLSPAQDSRGRPSLRETPILRVPVAWTPHELMAHESVGPGQYRVRVRNADGAFITHRDYDWRDDDGADDDGVEVIDRRRRVELPDSPPPAPTPTPPSADVMQILADARDERERALASQREMFEAQIAALKKAAADQLNAVKGAAGERYAALEGEAKRLQGEVNRLGGELAKAEKVAFEERMERRLAEARLEMRPAEAAPLSAPAAQSIGSIVETYRKQRDEFEALQAQLGGLAGNSGDNAAPAEVDVAAMMPRVMDHFTKLGDMFEQFERLSDKFGALL